MVATLTRNWNGYLTKGNVELIVERLRTLLDGKKYVLASANEYFGFKPEVKLGQELVLGKKTGSGIDFKITETSVIIFITGPDGVFDIVTHQGDSELIDVYTPYFTFKENEVTIAYFSGAKYKLYRVFAVEDGE